MIAENPCPPTTELEQFANGCLAGPISDSLANHIATCPRCQQRLDQIKTPIEEAIDLKRLQQPVPAELKRAVENAKRWTDTLDNASTRSMQPFHNEAAIRRILAEDGYEVRSRIGEGGMGIVYKAFQASLDRYVAIKVLAPHYANDRQARIRFLREAKSAASINHPNVVTVHAVSDHPHLPYLVMQYVKGHSLRDRMETGHRFSTANIARIGQQIASGLEAAQKQGIVHRDIKPANIFLHSETGRVLIGDFGLARSVESSQFTKTGVLMGTPAFLAPEVLQGNQPDHRADLFSLGVLLYELCVGESPFQADTALATLHRVAREQPRNLTDLEPNVPAWLADVVERLLAKAPEQRFQSAAEVKLALKSQQKVRIQTLSNSPPTSRKTRSNPWIIGTIVSLLLVIAGATTLILNQGSLNGDSQASAASANEPQGIDGKSQRTNANASSASLPESPQSNSGGDYACVDATGHIIAAFDSLDDAIESCQEGQKIEIRCNGELELAPLFIEKEITIAAADGYTPILTIAPDEESAHVEIHSHQLTLLDLHLRTVTSQQDGFTLFEVAPNASLVMDGCQVHLLSKRDPIGVALAGHLSLSDTVIRAPHGCGVQLDSARELPVSLTNSWLLGHVGFRVAPEQDVEIRINASTIVCDGVFELDEYDEVEFGHLHVSATESILIAGDDTLLCGIDEADILEEHTHWQGRNNVFGGRLFSFDQDDLDQHVAAADGWNDWAEQHDSMYRTRIFQLDTEALLARIASREFQTDSFRKQDGIEAGAGDGSNDRD